MGKMLLALIGLCGLVACATVSQTQMKPEGIVFETGKSRRAVMDAIVEVAIDDGYTVASISDTEGTITFDPRKMLDGTLNKKTTGNDWNIQTRGSTFNRLIQFSARVSKHGVVQLKTLVMVSGLNGPVDSDRSEKLARYYEKKIIQELRRRPPKLVMWITDMTACQRKLTWAFQFAIVEPLKRAS
jgi:hypothetical protein